MIAFTLKMTYWERTIQFHEEAGKDDPSGEAGLVAIRKIRNLIGSSWDPLGPGQHPLHNRLQLSSEDNYWWLIKFAAKLEELLKIQGHEDVQARLGASDSYLPALQEMDFALKMRLSGLPCRFVDRKDERTPDLTLETSDQRVDVEVTSLNGPYENEAAIKALDAILMIAFRQSCVSGGFWGRVPKENELELVIAKVRGAVEEAVNDHKMVELNEPGLLTGYFAPTDLASQIPPPWQRSWVVRTLTPIPKQDRLVRTIKEKAERQLSRGNTSILVIYDRFSSPDEARGLLDQKDIELMVGTFPKMAGVLLIYQLNADRSLPVKKTVKENRAYVEYSISDREAEMCVIWGNPSGKHRSALEPIVQSMIDFPRNLDQLNRAAGFSGDIRP